MPEREPEADAEGTLALGHQLARGVVDGRDVVGIERVAQPQRVRGQPEPDREPTGRAQAIVMRRDQHDQDEEAQYVQADHRARHRRHRPPLAARQLARHRRLTSATEASDTVTTGPGVVASSHTTYSPT